MTDLHARFRTIDRLRAPDLWSDVEARALATPDRVGRRPSLVLIATAVLLTLVVGGAVAIGGGLVHLPVLPVPSPTTELSPQPTGYAPLYAPLGEVMPAGRYVMPQPNTDGAGTWPVRRVIVTVPGGWTQNGPSRGGGVLKHGAVGPGDNFAALMFGRIGSLQCASYDLPEAGEPIELSAGETIDDLLRSLRYLPGVEVTNVVIDGYRGRRIEFTAQNSTCGWPTGWSTPSGGERWNYSWSVGWRHQLSILDIDGVRFVIDASYRLDTSPDLAAEVQAMVDSIELE